MEKTQEEKEIRAELEERYGEVWNTKELERDFNLSQCSFLAPFLMNVVRKSDGKKGSLTFRHAPRFYYDFR